MDYLKNLSAKRKNFDRCGSTYQFKIKDSKRLKDVLDLDEAFWVAINAPIETIINIDSDFLIFIDADNDDNIRPSEVKRAIKWLIEHLTDLDDVQPNNLLLNLNKINRKAFQGEKIYNAAMGIFKSKNLEEKSGITLKLVRDHIYKENIKITDDIHLLEKLILYQANILQFLNSYVSFPDLYNPKTHALFEMGTLIMDGRRFNLSVKVPDIDRHIQFCDLSKMFVLYVRISEKKGNELFDIAVPVTSGMRGNLKVNKLGIFKDIHGKEFHAKVFKIVENPISFSEALISPFLRIGMAVASKIDEMSTKAEEKLEELTTGSISTVGISSRKKDKQLLVAGQSSGSMLAGGAVAVAALSSSVAFITKILSGLTLSSIFGGLLCIFIAVLLPTGIIAFIKLSKRDLSAILEGSGWGINTRMKLTYRQARTFTTKPVFSAKKPENNKN